MTPWLLSLKTLLLPPSLQNKFRTLSNVWKMVCKKGSQLIPSLYAYAVLYDFPTPASKRWNLFFHPWNLALVIWLALVNWKLENGDTPETYRAFAHWDLPSLAAFGLQSQKTHVKKPMLPSWRRRPTSEWGRATASRARSANSSPRPDSTCPVFWYSLS